MWKAIQLIPLLGILMSCSGGSGGGAGGPGGENNTPSVYNSLDSSVGTISAVVLDSAIEGLEYSASPSQLSGTTDTGGRISCMGGDVVTLKIGTHALATVPCRPVITPVEMITKGKVLSAFGGDASSLILGSDVTGLSSSQKNSLYRLVTLLQTLDYDGDLSNGITIQPSILPLIQSMIDQKSSSLAELLGGSAGIDSEWTDALEGFATEAGGAYTARTDIDSAMSHFLGTLSSKSKCQSSDIPRAQSVIGISGSCIATSCQSGSELENGICVSSDNVGLFDGVSSHTCLYGKMYMDSSYPSLVNGNNPAFTLIILDNDSNDAFVLRTSATSDLANIIDLTQTFDSTDYETVRTTKQLKYFPATYNRNILINNVNQDNLQVSNIGFSDNPNSYLEFITQSMPIDATNLMTGSGQFGVGLNSGEFDWHVEASCTLPTNIE